MNESTQTDKADDGGTNSSADRGKMEIEYCHKRRRGTLELNVVMSSLKSRLDAFRYSLDDAKSHLVKSDEKNLICIR